MPQRSAFHDVKTAKLFRNGSSQAVRLPAEFRFEGEEVFIWRDELAGTVVLSPRRRTTWADFVAARAAVAQAEWDDFMTDRQQPSDQEREPLEIDDGKACA